MSNNGPRFQARGQFGRYHIAMVVDTVRSFTDKRSPTVCDCPDIETAIIIARALNRDAMS